MDIKNVNSNNYLVTKFMVNLIVIKKLTSLRFSGTGLYLEFYIRLT